MSVSAVMMALAHPDWKIHPTFDEVVTRIVDTHRFVYFTSRTQPYVDGSKYNATEYLSLFRYDKENDELMSLSSDNLLSSPNVSHVEYSPEKGFLAVVDIDNDVTLLYDNGERADISAYRYADTTYDKTVNSVFIDPSNGMVCLSTAFGYAVIDPEKREIRESRFFGERINYMGRAGDRQLLLSGYRLVSAPFDSQRFKLADYEEVEPFKGVEVRKLVNVDENLCLVLTAGGDMWKLVVNDGEFETSHLLSGPFLNFEHNSCGVTATLDSAICQIYPDGTYERVERYADDYGVAAGSYDMKEIWNAGMRRGLWSRRLSGDDKKEWTLTRDCMLPNAPSPFMATEMEWHSERGLLVVNHGYDPNFDVDNNGGPVLLSSYSDGYWSNLSPVYTNPGGVERLRNPNGLAIDPDNPDMVYFGSLMNGMERINMSDGNDVIHFSRKNDPYNNLAGFVELVADQTGNPSPLPGIESSWAASCPFAGPKVDAYGNLWTVYADYDDQQTVQLHLICWETDARRASVTADRVVKPVIVKEPGIVPGNRGYVLPLHFSGHRNWIAYSRRAWDGDLSLIDTGGTPTDPSDDRVVTAMTFVDQDGATFDVNDIRFIWEDPSTGNLWVGHRAGVFYFDPEKMLAGAVQAMRIKVSRGDGTNLADYLLDGVPVNKMTIDGLGRKWFATGGAGVVCTSSDGRIIKQELTSGETPLPDDNVYGLGYIPATNSLMISTERGMAEYFIKGEVTTDGEIDVRVYPNPVRPGYLGYVTIDGLSDNALVKIVDASGNIVKELGFASGGEIKWDVTNLSSRRVASGVYYVLCSSGAYDNAVSKVGKVLVVN